MAAAIGTVEAVATTVGGVITAVGITEEALAIALHPRGQGPAAVTVPAPAADGMAIPAAGAADRGQDVRAARAATSVRMAGLVGADMAAPAVAIAESCKTAPRRAPFFMDMCMPAMSGTGFSREEASADTLIFAV